MKTKTIAGRKVTLEVGKRYVATRPMASKHRQLFPVNIKSSADLLGAPVAVVGEMTYAEANRFLAAFNNGRTSFDGRVW